MKWGRAFMNGVVWDDSLVAINRVDKYIRRGESQVKVAIWKDLYMFLKGQLQL